MKKRWAVVVAVFIVCLMIFFAWYGINPVSFSNSYYSFRQNLSEAKQQVNPKEDLIMKKVALTYDDGPEPKYTRELLEILSHYKVKATFFVMGKQCEENPQVLEEIARAGHVIGNHTYHHENLNQLSYDKAKEELSSTSQLIYQITGSYPSLFRPPFGNTPKRLEEESDMLFVRWDVDPLDWQCQNTGQICRKVMKNIAENDIILMHDAYSSTVEATAVLIPRLQEAGYTFVTVEELLMD